MNMNFLVNDFYCVECGNKGICLPRKNGKYREAGHLKKIYCVKCKKQVNHVEIRSHGDYDLNDFMLERKYHNFDNDGNRKESYKIFRCHLRQKGAV